MSAVLDQPWPECLLPRAHAPEVHRRAKRALGFVPRVLEYTGCVPWAADIDRLATIQPLCALDADVANLGALAGTHATTCRHCYGGTRAAMLLLGYSEAQVDGLSDRLYGGEIAPEVGAAADFIRRVVALEARPEDLARLAALGFAQDAVVEMVVVGSLGTMYSRVATPLAVPPSAAEGMQRSPLAPLIGFFLRRDARRRKLAWRDQRSGEVDVAGPFAEVLRPLLPGPAARELRGLLDACLQARVCPRRSKLLAMAVVARAAGDPVLERALTGRLEEDGLPAAASARVLADLKGEGLDPFGQGLLHYARDSVRAGPADIQQSARRLAAGQAPELVVDAICAVALANGLGRLSVLRGG